MKRKVEGTAGYPQPPRRREQIEDRITRIATGSDSELNRKFRRSTKDAGTSYGDSSAVTSGQGRSSRPGEEDYDVLMEGEESGKAVEVRQELVKEDEADYDSEASKWFMCWAFVTVCAFDFCSQCKHHVLLCVLMVGNSTELPRMVRGHVFHEWIISICFIHYLRCSHCLHVYQLHRVLQANLKNRLAKSPLRSVCGIWQKMTSMLLGLLLMLHAAETSVVPKHAQPKSAGHSREGEHSPSRRRIPANMTIPSPTGAPTKAMPTFSGKKLPTLNASALPQIEQCSAAYWQVRMRWSPEPVVYPLLTLAGNLQELAKRAPYRDVFMQSKSIHHLLLTVSRLRGHDAIESNFASCLQNILAATYNGRHVSPFIQKYGVHLF